jgi:hypothetical protein
VDEYDTEDNNKVEDQAEHELPNGRDFWAIEDPDLLGNEER